MSTMTKTFRGRSLEEVLPQVRRELGEDAVILERRETRDGGVGGFFQQRMIEVEAASGAAARAFRAELERAEEDLADGLAEAAPAPPPAPAAAAPAHRPHVDERVADVSVDDLFTAPRQDAGLASLFSAGREEPETGGQSPHLTPEPSAWQPPQLEQAETGGRSPRLTQAPQPDPAAEPETGGQSPHLTPEPVGQRVTDPTAVVETLEGHGMDPLVAREVVAEAGERLAPLQPDVPAAELVRTALARRIPVARLGAGPRVVAVVGAGGTGKTTLAGRLAAAQARADRPVAALALRAPDDGAALGRHAGVPVRPVASGADVAGHGAAGLAVLDTPAISPRDPEAVRALAADLRAAGAAEVHLVLPATTGAHAARELLRAFADLGVTALAISHADETDQLGTAVGLAIETGLPISFVGAAAPDAHELAERLLQR